MSFPSLWSHFGRNLAELLSEVAFDWTPGIRQTLVPILRLVPEERPRLFVLMIFIGPRLDTAPLDPSYTRISTVGRSERGRTTVVLPP